ncbi:MAG: hypothetical protein ACLFTT_13485 [Candidatus Hydrogenedentota bacterium]
MKSSTSALIWEQWRLAGVTALTLFGVAMPLMVILSGVLPNYYWSVTDARWLSPIDAKLFCHATFLATALGAAVLFMLRFDGAGHLRASFDKRLARLPVKTLPLATIPFLTRLAFLTVLILALGGLYTLLLWEPLDLFSLLFPLVLYSIAQAYAWSRKAVTGLDYLLPLVVILTPLLILLFRSYATGYLGALAAFVTLLASPYLTPPLVAAAFGVALLGVHWERQDIRRGLPTVSEIRDFATGRFSISARHTASPLAAMVWYESRRMGARMPLVYLALVVLGFVITLSIPGVREEASLVAQFIPLLALPIAALVGGAPSLWSKSRYALLRPVETRTIAQAKIIAAVRVLTGTTLLATALSLVGFYIAARNAELVLIQQAYAAGEIAMVEIAGMLLGPCLLAFAVAWVACGLGTRVMGLLVGGSVGGALGVGAMRILVSGSHAPMLLIYLSFIVLLCLLLPSLLLYAMRLRALRPAASVLLVALWLGVAAFTYMVGPDSVQIVIPLSTQGLPANETRFYYSDIVWRHILLTTPVWCGVPGLAMGALLAGPFLAIAHSTDRRRTG